jgi:hypothetical protein
MSSAARPVLQQPPRWLVLEALAVHGNPYGGHTLADALAQIEQIGVINSASNYSIINCLVNNTGSETVIFLPYFDFMTPKKIARPPQQIQ